MKNLAILLKNKKQMKVFCFLSVIVYDNCFLNDVHFVWKALERQSKARVFLSKTYIRHVFGKIVVLEDTMLYRNNDA